jgi:hypothetical protein
MGARGPAKASGDTAGVTGTLADEVAAVDA